MDLERRDNDEQALASDAADFAPARLWGRHVYLRPVMQEDYRFLRAAELSTELTIRWRPRGTAGGPEQWVQSIWQAVLAQFVIVSQKEPKPLGLVCAYRPSFQDGHVYVGVVGF